MAFVCGAFPLASTGNQPGRQRGIANTDPGVQLAFIQALFHGLPNSGQAAIEFLQAANLGQQAIGRHQHNMGGVAVQPAGLIFQNPGFLGFIGTHHTQIRRQADGGFQAHAATNTLALGFRAGLNHLLARAFNHHQGALIFTGAANMVQHQVREMQIQPEHGALLPG